MSLDPPPPPASSDPPADSTDSDDESSDSDSKPAPPSDPAASAKVLLKAGALKDEGNAFFKEKEYPKAIRSYRRAVSSVKRLQTDEAQALLVSLHNNMSMVYFKQEDYSRCLSSAGAALKVDPENVKALFRTAQAARKTGDYDKAKEALKNAIKLDPTNKDVKKEAAMVKKGVEEEKRRAKKVRETGWFEAFVEGGED